MLFPLFLTDLAPRATLNCRALATPGLRRRLRPEGPASTAYETLSYAAELILLDPAGHQALVRRTEQVRFLQAGVTAILDHYWGDGIPLTEYHHTAGTLAESFHEDDRRYLVIDLPRPMRRGETLTFEVERTALVGFTADEEWLETTIDRPIHHLDQRIVFPRKRPCQWAELHVAGCTIPLRPIVGADGRTRLHYTVPEPETATPYLVHWRW